MSAEPQISTQPSAAREGQLASMDPTAARAYLLSIASTLRATQRPDYRGDSAARINECILVLSHLALDLGPPQGPITDAAETALYESVDKIAGSPQRSFDPARFERYLRTHPAGGAATRIVASKLLQGGRSKQTVLVSLENQGPSWPNEMVIRQDWGKGVPNISVVFEYYVVEALRRTGIKAPETLFLEISAEPMGAPFMAVTRLNGCARGNLFSPPASERMALQLAQQLGVLHSMPIGAFAAVPDLPTRAYTHLQMRAELEEYRRQYAAFDRPNPTIDAIFAWLSAGSEKISGPQSLVHGDLGFHNYLVAGDDLTGILDWELAHLGSPAEDLGYCRGDIEQMTTWTKFIQTYRAAGGPDIDARVLDFYTLWSGLHLYCLLLQARAGIVSGQLHDIEVIYCCVNLTPVLLRRMARQLREATRRASP
jgi:aminoglycoside phosphotransferase (APT) family kinase protein